VSVLLAAIVLPFLSKCRCFCLKGNYHEKCILSGTKNELIVAVCIYSVVADKTVHTEDAEKCQRSKLLLFLSNITGSEMKKRDHTFSVDDVIT